MRSTQKSKKRYEHRSLPSQVVWRVGYVQSEGRQTYWTFTRELQQLSCWKLVAFMEQWQCVPELSLRTGGRIQRMWRECF